MPLISKAFKFSILLVVIFTFLLQLSCRRPKQISDLPGTWNGVVYLQNRDEVPLKIELNIDGENVTGSILNGDERVTSTSGSFDVPTQTLRLKFDYFDAVLEAGFARRELIGTLTRTWHDKKLIRELKMWKGSELMVVPAATEGKDISGEWEMKVGEGDKQKIWKLVVKQTEGKLAGTILTPSGDWGAMTGAFGYGKMQLSHTDVINAHIFRAQLNANGQLEGMVDLGQGEAPRKVIAERIANISASNDPSTNTRVKNPAEPFRFAGIDFANNKIDQSDPRFKNKVLVIEITGTWCPNCYDEAPLLKDLYARYQAQGLEVLGLAFEYTGDTKRDLEQVKIFNKKHDIPYLMLLGGTTENNDIEKKIAAVRKFWCVSNNNFYWA